MADLTREIFIKAVDARLDQLCLLSTLCWNVSTRGGG